MLYTNTYMPSTVEEKSLVDTQTALNRKRLKKNFTQARELILINGAFLLFVLNADRVFVSNNPRYSESELAYNSEDCYSHSRISPRKEYYYEEYPSIKSNNVYFNQKENNLDSLYPDLRPISTREKSVTLRGGSAFFDKIVLKGIIIITVGANKFFSNGFINSITQHASPTLVGKSKVEVVNPVEKNRPKSVCKMKNHDGDTTLTPEQRRNQPSDFEAIVKREGREFYFEEGQIRYKTKTHGPKMGTTSWVKNNGRLASTATPENMTLVRDKLVHITETQKLFVDKTYQAGTDAPYPADIAFEPTTNRVIIFKICSGNRRQFVTTYIATERQYFDLAFHGNIGKY